MFNFKKTKYYKKEDPIPLLIKWGLTSLSTTCYSKDCYNRHRYGYEIRGTLSDRTNIIIADITSEPDFIFYINDSGYYSPFRVKRCSHGFRFSNFSHLRDILVRLKHEPLLTVDAHAKELADKNTEASEVKEVIAIFKRMLQ